MHTLLSSPTWLLLFSYSVVSNSLQPHWLQHTRLPCLSPSLGACPNLCPWNQWGHPAISSSVIRFSSRLQSFPASGSFLVSQVFTLGEALVSALALPMNIQHWFPLGLTDVISLKSTGLMQGCCKCNVESLKLLFMLMAENKQHRDFPGGPVAKTLQTIEKCTPGKCRKPVFNPWSGN